MKQLALLGASGHGKVLADMAGLLGWERVVFFDDAWPNLQHNGAWAVEGSTDDLMRRLPAFDGVVVSIGHGATRWAKQQTLQQAGARIATLIHPAAHVSPYATLGAGTVVMAGAVVNAYACVGMACIVNTNASVDHDCLLGDAVHIGPGAHVSGNVTVGDAAWIGVGAAVKQGLAIGAGAMVGAGAAVVHAVLAGTTVAGNPARVLKPKTAA